MPVTGVDFTFVCKLPDGTEGRKTYPAGTTITPCPPGNDAEAGALLDCLQRARKSTGQDHFIVLIDGFRTVLPTKSITSATRK